MILIDGSNITKMPTGLQEFYEYIRTDTTTLGGTMQRNQSTRKRCAVLNWKNLKAADQQAILTWADTITTHTYLNNASGKYGTWGTFTALITITEDGNYLPGGAYMLDSLTIKIREV